jgi:hypothetical protein
MLVAWSSFSRALVTFGGEDPFIGQPWYHAGMTSAAAGAAGWSESAALDLAWHSAAADSYLYNPARRWVVGAHRRRAVRYVRRALVSMHFDDMTSTEMIEQAWNRYTAGCVAAVLWCAPRRDIAAARHAVGLTLHALQDFYSHSTWLDDPCRWTQTWWEMEPSRRRGLRLTTGAYMRPAVAGMRQHGGLGVTTPWVRGASARPGTAFGSSLLARLIEARPPGLNLDSRWQARVGASVRGMRADEDAGPLFDAAVTLALRSSGQWLEMLDRAFRDADESVRRFWAEVRTNQLPPALRQRALDDRARQAAWFLAAGARGVSPQLDAHAGREESREGPAGEEAGWFLHVVDRTGGRNPLLLGPYAVPPQRLRVSFPDDTDANSVAVFVFRNCWPFIGGWARLVRSGGVGVGFRDGARQCREVRLDHSMLVSIETPFPVE